MVYCVTKDCGTGWDDTLKSPKPEAWGVSERQRSLAEKIRPGDVFLHYIDRVHAWAGYSMVTGKLQANDRDLHPDWVDALPQVIPIAVLVKQKCRFRRSGLARPKLRLGLMRTTLKRQV